MINEYPMKPNRIQLHDNQRGVAQMGILAANAPGTAAVWHRIFYF
jgi:uncharacterized membrane protein YeiB